MKIILSHGRGSSKDSKEMFHLARTAEKLGFPTHRVNDVDSEDPELRAARLVRLLAEENEKVILVGFSMGGYTSMLAAAAHPDKVKGLFLLAPALYVTRYQVKSYPTVQPTEIIHGWDDDIILYENSVRYAREHNCVLHLVPGEHTFLKSEELEMICAHFHRFLTPFT